MSKAKDRDQGDYQTMSEEEARHRRHLAYKFIREVGERQRKERAAQENGKQEEEDGDDGT